MPLDGRLLAGVTVFSTVVEYGSFARAGEALGISASGVSHAIARLETRMGVRLIERTTRAMCLTEEGRRFYERVRPSLEEIEDAKPLRLQVVTVGPSDTVEKLATRMAVTDRQVERFRVLNGLEPGERLKSGSEVKIVVE